ncbi:MAG: acyl-CoA thioesterase [Steroidobacteraceae bacterium]
MGTPPPIRAGFPVFRSLPTRWMDNDHYGHVNNVAYYSFFDTAVNGWLIEASGVDIRALPAIGLVVETSCRYFKPLSFPDALEVGLAIERLGARSITYRLAIFRAGEADAVAAGRFVHVYVDAQTREPTAIPAAIRAIATNLANASGYQL